jgi:hypothetical protein
MIVASEIKQINPMWSKRPFSIIEMNWVIATQGALADGLCLVDSVVSERIFRAVIRDRVVNQKLICS